jgi:hypothetical protein
MCPKKAKDTKLKDNTALWAQTSNGMKKNHYNFNVSS